MRQMFFVSVLIECGDAKLKKGNGTIKIQCIKINFLTKNFEKSHKTRAFSQNCQFNRIFCQSESGR